MTNPDAAMVRFVSKVTPNANGCLVWSGPFVNKGYGAFHVDGKRVRAQRWIYELVHGPIPVGLVVDHLCRNHSCVNPTHLDAVTNRENVLRGVGTPAVHARKTHCPAGHEYDKFAKNGWRYCRPCRAAWKRARRVVLRAEREAKQ
jgi:hypothetical protein